MKRGIIVSLFDLSGRMLEPWVSAGIEVYAVDIQHPSGIAQIDGVNYVGANVLDCISSWFPQGREVSIAFGFPPCTHTAVSGARHFKAKGAPKAAEAFQLIARCHELLNWFDAPYAWEQPVSTTSTYVGKPNHTFDPCEYAGYLEEGDCDRYTKKTCLWTGGGFIMPEKKPLAPVKVCKQGSWVQKLGGASQKTKNLRSATPRGFAQAVYEANAQQTS